VGGGALSYAADVLDKSGTVGVATTLVFFVCIGIGLERLLFWIRLWGPARLVGLRSPRREARRVDEVERLVRSGRFREAGALASRVRHPAMRLLGTALGQLRTAHAWRSTRDRVIAETLGGNVTLGRRFLITAIQGFGLLGMLGTCKGLYAQLSSFGAVAGEAAELQGAMSGMGEAFTTTLVGLTAAVLTILIYLPNEVAIERFHRELRRFDSRIQSALLEYDSRGDGSVADGTGET